MKRIINKFKSDDVFRSWLYSKVGNPFSRNRKLERSLPAYLINFNTNVFNAFKINPIFPTNFNIPLVKDDTLILYTPSAKLKLNIANAIKFFFDKKLLATNQDNEDREAIFRFSGLFQSICNRNGFAEVDDQLITSWCESSIDTPEAFDSYTISERISHICTYLMLTKAFQRWPQIQYQKVIVRLTREAKFLFNHLEYYGETLTGNHFSNNGKAFLWLGHAMGSKKMIELGYLIMNNEIPRIFRGGLVSEGSVHYHFLIVRNYLEALILLRNSNLDFDLSEITNTLRKAISTCKHLILGEGSISNIGDISPDCPIDWLISIKDIDLDQITYIETNKFYDFCSLFHLKLMSKANDLSGSISNEFCKLRVGNYSVLIHKNPKGYSPIPSHSHCDTGSYCMAKDNNLIVWDKGRNTYQTDNDVLSRDHSCVFVNDIGPDFREMRLFNETFNKRFAHKCNQFTFEVMNEKQVCTLDLTYRNNIRVIRLYQLSKGGLREEINIIGKGKKAVSFKLYLSENTKIKSSIKFKTTKALVSPYYGHQMEVNVIEINELAKLPFNFWLEVS